MLKPVPLAHSLVLWGVGRDVEAIAASQKAIDLGEPYAVLNLIISHMWYGEVEAATADYASYLQSRGKDASGAEAWVRAANDPITGRQFLLEERREPVSVFMAARWAFFLAFGHLDDFFDVLDQNVDPDAVWYDGDDILQTTIVMRRTGIASHPRYLPMMEKMGIIALWDERGAPDHCTKETGAWVCE